MFFLSPRSEPTTLRMVLILVMGRSEVTLGGVADWDENPKKTWREGTCQGQAEEQVPIDETKKEW